MVRRLLLPLVAVLVALGIGISLGAHPSRLPGFVRDPLVGDQDTRVVNEALGIVKDEYYRDIPSADLSNAAISGVVSSLGDRFSNYFPPREYAQFQQSQTSPSFTGIGTTVQEDPRGLRIGQVYDGSPAQLARLQPGDVIVQAGDKRLRGLTSQQATTYVKGPRGTEVHLKVLRDGRELGVTVKRDVVAVPQVTDRIVTRGGTKYGVVSLAQFGEGVHAKVAAAVRQVDREGAEGIVLDLRDNPGGLVTEAQLVASVFLRDGTIVTTRGRAVPSRTLKATGNPVAPTTPLVVLVNRNTASAAEIVSGALQDDKRATIVGEGTFGKGVFQEVIELSNGGALDITAGQYFTPSGRNLGGRGVEQGEGIQPSVKAVDDPDTARDEAQDAALATLARER